MAHLTHHPSDEALIRAVDGEQSPRELAVLEKHLADCAPCRARRQELHAAADEFYRAYRLEFGARAPGVEGLRERLRANVSSLSKELDRSWHSRLVQGLTTVPRAVFIGAALAALVAIVSGAAVVRLRFEPLAPDDTMLAVEPGVLPVRSLTPGATRPVRVDELCAGREAVERPISTAVRQAVLRDYRMEGVPVHEYELDYLITPELGGSGDRRNLWPERYGARVWNARVKDELEQLLPQMVCHGEVDLATAQRDIAVNWIAAYKKYFHTDLPRRTRSGASRNDDGVPALVSRLQPSPAGFLERRARVHWPGSHLAGLDMAPDFHDGLLVSFVTRAVPVVPGPW